MRPPVGPQGVGTTLKTERRKVALVDLTVVAYLTDDLIREVSRETKSDLGHLSLYGKTEEPADVGVVGVHEVTEVARGDPVLFGLHRGHGGPIHDLCPLSVAISHHRPEGLFGDDVAKDACADVECVREGRQLGGIRSPNFTLPGNERRLKLIVGLELNRVEGDSPVAEHRVEVQQRRGALKHTDVGVGHVFH